MKAKNYYPYMAALCYSFFSLAMAVLPQGFTVWDWMITIALNGAVYIVFILLIFDGRQNNPITDLICLGYILFLLAKQIYIYNGYIKTYHRQIQSAGNIFLTALIIIMLCSISREKAERLAMPAFVMLIILLVVILWLNCAKANPANLYKERQISKISFYNITLFDYIIPLGLSLEGQGKQLRKKGVLFVLLQSLAVILVIVFSYSCLKGNLLYSISPLQIMFQISTGELIKNFEPLFNYFMYFLYFSAVLLNITAYLKIKERFKYIGRFDLFLLIPMFLLQEKTDNFLFFLIQAVLVIILFLTKRRGKVFEKN